MTALTRDEHIERFPAPPVSNWRPRVVVDDALKAQPVPAKGPADLTRRRLDALRKRGPLDTRQVGAIWLAEGVPAGDSGPAPVMSYYLKEGLVKRVRAGRRGQLAVWEVV